MSQTVFGALTVLSVKGLRRLRRLGDFIAKSGDGERTAKKRRAEGGEKLF
jgi:hypothetical protein